VTPLLPLSGFGSLQAMKKGKKEVVPLTCS
jgi:hypothetical protein